MTLERIGLSLMEISLVMSLWMRLQREMGQKSMKVLGLSHLGTRVRKVEFKDIPTVPSLWESSTTFRGSRFTKSKKKIKNSTDHPLGPGLLSFLKLFREDYNYFNETSTTIHSKSSVDKQDGK